MIAIPFALHLTVNAKPFQHIPCGLGTVGRIRVKGRLVAQQKCVTFGAVMGIARRDRLAVNEAVLVF